MIHPTAIVDKKAELEAGVKIGPYSVIYAGVKLGKNTEVGAHCIIGEANRPDRGPTIFGDNSIIRSGSVIYAGVIAGNRFEGGPKVFIRENTVVGENFRVGTLSDIEGDCTFGDYCRVHSNVFVAKGAKIGNFVWLFPAVVITNDPHPPSEVEQGVIIDDYAAVAAGSIILPGVRIGEGSVVGALSLVSKDVRAGMLVRGNPAVEVYEVSKIKNRLNPKQSAYPWPEHYEAGLPWKGIGFQEWKKMQENEKGR